MRLNVSLVGKTLFLLLLLCTNGKFWKYEIVKLNKFEIYGRKLFHERCQVGHCWASLVPKESSNGKIFLHTFKLYALPFRRQRWDNTTSLPIPQSGISPPHTSGIAFGFWTTYGERALFVRSLHLHGGLAGVFIVFRAIGEIQESIVFSALVSCILSSLKTRIS